MTAAAGSLIPATRSRPCPVCGRVKSCSWKADGFHLCFGGEPNDPTAWRKIGSDSNGFTHFRRADDPPPTRNGHHHPPPPKQPSPPRDLVVLAEQYAREMTPERVRDFAGRLGLPPTAMDSFPLVGFLRDVQPGDFESDPELAPGPCYLMPEFDGYGRVVGLNRRFADGFKKAVFGHKRGLSVPANWRNTSGPLLIPEGFSDTLALTACGICAVGRPNNRGGAEQLAVLLRDFPRDRDIVVLGEHDQRPDDNRPGGIRWPGREGVDAVAPKLAELLGRPVKIAFPGNGFKDARCAIVDAIAGAGEELDMAAIGREFLAALEYDAPPEPEKPVDPPGERRWRFKPLGSADFANGDFRPVWLVKKLLALGQPTILAGVHKSLKTSVAVDLGVSLATATAFLSKFDVPISRRVLIVSGESGPHTLQESVRRVCGVRGLDPAGLTNLLWQFDLPQLGSLEDLVELERGIKEIGVEVLILDPAYLCMLSGAADDAKNVFSMGSHLRVISELCQRSGCSLILVHHANRTLQPGSVMELSNIAFAGFAEFARQWLLLSRAEPYRGDGEHQLLLNAGGSCGQGGLYAVHVSEGTLDEGFGGRRWEVTVTSPDEARADRVAEKETKKKEEARQRMRSEETSVLNAVDKTIEGGQPAITLRQVRDHCPTFSHAKAKEVVGRLIEDGVLEEIEYEKPQGNGAKVTVAGFRRPVRTGDG